MTGTVIAKQELVDQIADVYLSWREECCALETAYRRWASAEPEDRRAAFVAYQAQLELEEHAARCYQRLSSLMSPLGVAPARAPAA